MLRILAHVELLAEFFNDFFWDLTLEDAEKLNVLAAIEFNFEDADWLLLWLHSITRNAWLALNRWCEATWFIGSAVSRLAGRRLEVGTSISGVPWLRL